MIWYKVAAGYLDISLNDSMKCSKAKLYSSISPTPKIKKRSTLPSATLTPMNMTTTFPRKSLISEKVHSSTRVNFLPKLNQRLVTSKKTPKEKKTQQKQLPVESSPKKTYSIEGTYPDVIDTLNSKGWTKHHPQHPSHFDLKWTKSSKIPSNLHHKQLINHIDGVRNLSVKSKLTKHLKKLPNWMNFYPETYVVKHSTLESCEAFKFSYIESYFKNHINGDLLPEHKLWVAIKVCENRLMHFRNGGNLYVSAMQWECFKSDTPTTLQTKLLMPSLSYEEMNEKAMEIVEELKVHDPQYNLRGDNHIWILKPGGLSRGRKIKVVDELMSIAKPYSQSEYLIQKYIERPLLIRDHKFDIRQWVLLLSCPLRVFIFKEAYLRFSTNPYQAGDLMNPYVHLTNISVSKKSPNFIKENSMWTIQQFGVFLDREYGKDIEEVSQGIREIVATVISSVKDFIGKRENSFELLGFDIMIDEMFKPWLIEVNSSPALDYSTDITKELVRKVIPNTLEVVLEGRLGSFEECPID